MITVAYVAPYFLPATVRFLAEVAALPGVAVGLVSADPLERLPAEVRGNLAAHRQIRDGLDPQQILDAVRAMNPQIGVPQRVLGTLEQLQVPLAQVRAALGVEGMSVESAHSFRDKARMKDVLRSHGLPCARHRLVTSTAEGMAFGMAVGYRAVVKPPDGAGGKSTYQVKNAEELAQALQRLQPAPGHPALCEEFVVGEERTLEVMTLAGHPVWWSSCRYAPTPLHVLENPWIQWTITLPREENDPSDPDVRVQGFQALKALGMHSGLSHMEWFRRPDGSIAISEIGARPPGAQIVSLTSLAHDTDLFRGWARAVTLGEFDRPARRYAAGAAFLRGQGTGDRVVAVHGLEEAQRRIGHLVAEAKLPQRGQARSSSYEGEGYVLIRHERTDVVDDALRQLVSMVRVEMG